MPVGAVVVKSPAVVLTNKSAPSVNPCEATFITPDVTTCPTLAFAISEYTIPKAGILALSSASANATCGLSPVLLPVRYTALPLLSVDPVSFLTS